MFKSYTIEYGYYVLAGVLASVIQHWLDLTVFQFWTVAFLAVAYFISVPSIHKLAWGKDQ